MNTPKSCGRCIREVLPSLNEQRAVPETSPGIPEDVLDCTRDTESRLDVSRITRCLERLEGLQEMKEMESINPHECEGVEEQYEQLDIRT